MCRCKFLPLHKFSKKGNEAFSLIACTKPIRYLTYHNVISGNWKMKIYDFFMHINHENRYIAITLRLVACGVFSRKHSERKLM